MRHRLLAALVVLPLMGGGARAETPCLVFAAASLKAPMADLSAAWVKLGHAALSVSLDSSATLAKQIQQGAPAQLFVSADEKWMDYLAKADLIVPASRTDLLTNTLVLVSPASSTVTVAIGPGLDLTTLLGPKGRLAVGDTASVPAGIYARQALTRLGAWSAVQARLAPAANVKAALLLVEQGEAPAGIVYGTDAKGDPKVRVVGIFPASSHDPIVYPAALVRTSGETPGSRAVLAFLNGRAARAIFAKYGFGAPPSLAK